MTYRKTLDVRWSDLGVNQSVSPAAYAMYATNTGVEWLRSMGCTIGQLSDLGVSSVLLKEQTEYFQEVFLGEQITVQAKFAGSSANNAKWKFIYEMFNRDNQLVAKHIVYGAWTDYVTKKIITPPSVILNYMAQIPHTDDFEILGTKH
jgi:acyl-CoA thioester hydrolase